MTLKTSFEEIANAERNADRPTPRKFSTTPGTRDLLPREAMRLSDVQTKVIERFRAHGFREVVTPALEYAEVIEEPALRDVSFKLFDPDNQMLLLRPEMTTPIARLVAQRMTEAPKPHKLSYCLPVYRRNSIGRGQSAEFHQAGVEVVGSPNPAEDAAALSLLIDVLTSLGLVAGRDFSVVLGQASFYRGYIEENAPQVAAELTESLTNKDLVRVDEIVSDLPDELTGAAEIPRIVGRADDEMLLEQAAQYASGRSAEALANLREVLGYLEASSGLEGVMLDFGLIGRRDYYSGTVYEVYASGMGFTVANGGRYDDLYSRFGEPTPATGFAISMERLVSVLPREEPSPLFLLVGAEPAVAGVAREMRELGVPVLHLPEDAEPADAARYAAFADAKWVAYPAAGNTGNMLKVAGVRDLAFEEKSVQQVARDVLGGAR